MPLSQERLREVVAELASRPRHEKVRTLVYELLVHGLGASSTEVLFERPVPEVRGRIDALLGRTVFEFKSDLVREQGDAQEELTRYLTERESETSEHYVGIATDGALFVPYELRGGKLLKLGPFQTPTAGPRDRRSPEELVHWLGAVVALGEELLPTPETVSRELGRGSMAWHVARAALGDLWDRLKDRPDVRLKRELWDHLLQRVYGGPVGEDTLFFQHTYLTTIAKTMATRVLVTDLPSPDRLLAGREFEEAGISGAVESDFFDWPLLAQEGTDLVRRIALQASRFRLRDVKTDVLKGLYESLIDPDQRHDLGEYYTPDWLAGRMCEQAITQPLNQRVLDPACGSGTFLFHAVRRLLAAAETAGVSNSGAIERACSQVFGIDVHPVAVQIARVTFLLALGEDRLKARTGNIAIPVYLSDSLQWNTRGFLAERDVLVEVPGTSQTLEFPSAVARDPAVFDSVLARMLELGRQGAGRDPLLQWLRRQHKIDGAVAELIARSYELLTTLEREGRDHIWGYVARNQVRPVWLSQPDMRVDVVIGNPPWLSFRFMSGETQERFRKECQARGLWEGGKVATHQDLSAYFFVRCVELYLKQDGLIAFVMPYAAMSRRQFAGFRTGTYGKEVKGRKADVVASVQFTQAWALDDVEVTGSSVFPVPACVLFAKQGAPNGKPALPATVQSAVGTLPERDATPAQAARALKWRDENWPTAAEDAQSSPYMELFRQGATMVPRMLCVVEEREAGRFGTNKARPRVESRRTPQEKAPWKEVRSLSGNVEKEFLRPLYLGESVAPYRLLDPALAIVPWHAGKKRLMDAADAQLAGYAGLDKWMAQAEELWKQKGRNKMELIGRWDYQRGLVAQFPVAPLRVVYSKAGTLQASALLRDKAALVDHKLYWARIETEQEGRYLCAVLNSVTARAGIEHLQSRGQWGARDFDKVMLSLPVPRFDASVPLHRSLAEAGLKAERVASQVPLTSGGGGPLHFVAARRAVRTALQEDGVAGEIDELVAELLRVPGAARHARGAAVRED
jgi:SAM-dependent methyltransferase